ncbi:hypothetical protein A2707_02825 [Candidatus Saccharibacteria bacterium RIFCSPHIGHO2_01_FULL_45_15]|nr:MAG: hypothetical protein A2707_02825 [Candidatus Saccharibacteria bacterium RIFCSPHIGHO2_01_FULL_45_15]OGL27048.1 MAG: hypothetical protein A3C39_00675 [Candidatus Saccharibacteria bacterium RIFCSPHIGHO2_02_FULL_46_12]OGL31858.1 MAG: hypothetical protein A3E76_03415 [Candidatus Saccharibacteria bacterium RIFCSPHIGHO2_12_FULL_44_22]
MAHKYPPATYLVDRLIPTESITILSGASRSYKTYTLLDIAIAVASQKPLFEHFNTTQANVLIINEEDGERLLQQRFRQLGIEKDTGLPIHISALTDFKLEDEQVDKTIQFCKDNEITLVIIDSLIRVHNADENSAREMSKVFAKLRRFTKAEIAVLVTQHNRKATQHSTGGASEMRGSSDILAAVDSHIGVKRDSKDRFYLTFTQEKQRYDVELDPFQMKFNTTDPIFKFEYLGTFRNQPDKSAVLLSAVVEILKEHGQLMQRELLEQLTESKIDTNEHELRELLKRWVNEGAIPKPNKGTGKSKLYHLEGTNDENE